MTMIFSPLLERLINALRCLPGVGPKSAQRMALHLLERNRSGGMQLAEILEIALKQIGHCQRCRTLCEDPICRLCANPKRDTGILCIVETPADVVAIEQTGIYKGMYFVLMGHLSPLDGIGAEQIGIRELLSRLQEQDFIREIILATNPTVEGEATAHYIVNLLRDKPIRITRIAHGVSLGRELEFVDGGTLARALTGRAPVLDTLS